MLANGSLSGQIWSVDGAILLNGKDTGSRDFAMLHVRAATGDDAIRKVAGRKAHAYRNDRGESVRWQLVDIYNVGRITRGLADMEEIVGFIAKKDEIYGRKSRIRPSLRYLLKTSRFDADKRGPRQPRR